MDFSNSLAIGMLRLNKITATGDDLRRADG